MSHAYADEYDDELDYLRPTPSPMTPKERATRAVIYLRVSSAAQVNTDYDPEGISIPAQRVACERKARDLGLTIVDEYIEPGRSGTEMSRRIAFQQMLSRVRQDKDVGHVIVYKLSRMARNRYDDAIVMADLRKRGISLISATEAVDDSPVGQLMHGILATFNEYQSRESGADIAYKMGQKAKNGGTLGQARIGYLNVFDRVDGREIRTVVPDPERADLIKLAFELYATGDYTLADLSDELYDRGLRTRQTPRREAKQVSINTLSTLLRDTYYLGRITYKGEEYPGRHQPIVDEDVFEQVQAVIASRSAAGERRRIHHHYLKGSVYCGVCQKAGLDRRLNVQVTTSKRGYQYWYFFCVNTRDAGACASRHVNVEHIERAVENHYATIRFDPQFITDVRAHIVETLTGEKTATRLLKQQLTKELHRLDVQEGNLIDLVSDASIPHAKARQKLREIEREREHLKARLNETDNTLAQDARLIEACFALLADPHQLYRCCNNEQRRLLNQALFARLYIHEEEIVGHELNEPFATLRTIHDQYRRAGTSARPPNAGQTTHHTQETNEAVPATGNGLCLVLLQGFNPGMDIAAVSNKPKKVELTGFELASPCVSGPLPRPLSAATFPASTRRNASVRPAVRASMRPHETARKHSRALTNHSRALTGHSHGRKVRTMGNAAFGTITKLPSGNFRAYYERDRVRHKAPSTFSRRDAAARWLAREQLLLDSPDWTPPADRSAAAAVAPTLATYAANAVARRELKPRTRADYVHWLARHVTDSTLGRMQLHKVRPGHVRAWFDGLTCSDRERAQTYALVHSVFREALAEELVQADPCRIKGAATTRSKHEAVIPTPQQLAELVAVLPPKYRALVLLAAYGALRYNEVAALRVEDFDLRDPAAPVVAVRRGVTWPDGVETVDTPKTALSVRPVPLPGFLTPVLVAHMAEHADAAGWLFTKASGGLLPAPAWEGVWQRARAKAGLTGMHFHDLRRTGATWGGAAGVPLADMQRFTGHSNVRMLLHYQQASSTGGRQIADAMPELPPADPGRRADVIRLRRKG